MSGNRVATSQPVPRTRGSAYLLAAVGCLGIATQLVLLRELMAAFGGNELSAGVTVAAWVLCEALGAWLAGHARSSFLVGRLSFLSFLSVLFSLTSVPEAVLARPLLGAIPGETLSIPLLLLATVLVTLLPAACHGSLFVAAASQRPQGLGSAYVWEGIGTALAGVACYLLLNSLPSLAVVALFSLALAMVLLASRDRFGGAAMASLGVLALFLAQPVERLAWQAAWRGQQVTQVRNSPYGKVVELERSGLELILYNGVPTLTVPQTRTERAEETALLPVLIRPSVRRVLVLGPDPAIPALLAGFRTDLEVVSAQIDPVLARASLAALSHGSSPAASRVVLAVSDPLVFLRRDTGAFDCIILTDPAPTSLGASRLFTSEFYRLCRDRLTPDGVLATIGPGTPAALSPDVASLVATRVRTLRTAFEHVLPVAADLPLMLASDRPLSLEPESVAARLAALSMRPTFLDSGYVAGLLGTFGQLQLASVLETNAATAQPSTTTSPRELFLNMVRENRLASPRFGALYALLGSPSLARRYLSVVLLLGVAVLVAGIAGALAAGSRFRSGMAILTSGFSGAAVSSLLLFVWQDRFGSVFSGVSLLVAAFMLGTVLGAALGNSLVTTSSLSGKSLLFPLLFVADLALLACAAAVVLLLRVGTSWLFLSANCLAGACLGLQFATAGNAATAGAVDSPSGHAAVGRAAGIFTALDLVGGSLGGLLTALVIVPAFGIGAAALLAGTVKLASALSQLVGARSLSRA